MNMNTKVTYIYGLLDENNVVKYVGKSDNPKKRFNEHIIESKKYKKTHKQRWIFDQIKNNKVINIKIIECVDYNIWGDREKYWINKFGLDNLTNYELGGKGGKPKSNWLPFTESRNIVRLLLLRNVFEWQTYCKSNHRNKLIPCYPDNVYKNDGWISWGDWLGTGFIATQNREYLEFDVAKKIIHKLNISSQNEWYKYIRKNELKGIPKQPNKVYFNDWVSWGDWLGTGFISTKNREYLPFNHAKNFIRSINIKTHKQWREFCKQKNNNIPSNPNVVYKKDWIDWNDWFGVYILSFYESKKIVKELHIKSNKEWRQYVKEGRIPNNIPTSPQTFFKNEWISWYDWLGK